MEQVTDRKPYLYADGSGPDIVVIDFGVKEGVLRELAERGCRVRVAPAIAKAEDILAERPDGVLFSSGPGDPQRCPLRDRARSDSLEGSADHGDRSGPSAVVLRMRRPVV